MRYDNTFLKLWWLLPLFLQPRFIRIMYAKYWFDWLKWYTVNIYKGYWNIEDGYTLTKELATDKDFCNIKPRRNK